MQQTKRIDTKQLVVMALLTALAYACVAFFRIPIVSFLKYEPKDCVLAIGGMLYGPVPALIMTLAVALLELVTVSDTGLIGLLMNVLSTAFFVVPAACLYHRRKTLANAVLGLAIGAALMTGAMMLWNWLITPLYMHVPRDAVVEMLLPVFLPFNLFKALLNAVLTTVLYKSVVSALRKARLVPQSEQESNRKRGLIVWLVGVMLLAILVLVLLIWKGIL